MWLYSQSTGSLWDDEGKRIATGYSGYAEGKNNPELEAIPFIGPIPKGLYHLGKPYDSKNIGPHAIPCEPVGHNCLGRTYFRIHGDSRRNPGNASKGCIIMQRTIRDIITNSDDFVLRVIE